MGYRRALTVIDVEVPQLTAALRCRSSSIGRLSALGRPEASSRRAGQACLLAVVVLWGTYSPAYRLIYAQPGPPQPQVLTALRASLQALLLLPPAALQASKSSSKPRQGNRVPEASPLIAGLELGLYNFAASGLQAVGLQYTTATRGSLLILATSIFTPLLARLGGARLAKEIWLGCLLALAGAALIACDHPAAAGGAAGGFSAAAASLSAGDWAVLGAAVGYSLATVRLEAWTSRLDTLPLAWAKSCGIAGYAVTWLAGDCLRSQLAGQDISSLWPQSGNVVVWAALLWSALGPGAAAAWLQTKGQAVVPAAEAQIIFSLTPIPAAAFAALLPGGAETMGAIGYLGGVLVMGASVTASLGQKPSPQAAAKAGDETEALSQGMSKARRSLATRVRSRNNLEEP